MAYGTVTFFSDVLGQDMTVDYILPDTRRRRRKWADCDWEEKKLPAIWVLHGNGDSHNAWIRKSNIELYARQFDVAVFMPACTRECYTDSKRGLNYFTYVADELPMVMRKYFPISDKREDNFVMGNSMGGYGALKCALTYPERYAAAASFSGAASFGKQLRGDIDGRVAGMLDTLLQVFGSAEEYENSENDLYELIRRLEKKESGSSLRIYQCCGTEDFLYKSNAELRDYLQEHVAADNYRYSEGPGGHDWFYWNPEIENVFSFFGFDVDNCWNDSGIVRK